MLTGEHAQFGARILDSCGHMVPPWIAAITNVRFVRIDARPVLLYTGCMRRSRINARATEPEHGSWAHRGQSTFGSFIRLKRVQQGLPRRRLAEESGVPEQLLQQIEVNQVTVDYRDIRGLAKALKVPEKALLEVAGYVKPGSG